METLSNIETTITVTDDMLSFSHEGKAFIGNPEVIQFTPAKPSSGTKINASVYFKELPKSNVIKKIVILRRLPDMMEQIGLLRTYYRTLVSMRLGSIPVELTNGDLIAKTKRFPDLGIVPEYTIQSNCELFTREHEISLAVWNRNPLVPEFVLTCNGKPVGFLNKSGKRLRSLVDDILEVQPLSLV